MSTKLIQKMTLMLDFCFHYLYYGNVFYQPTRMLLWMKCSPFCLHAAPPNLRNQFLHSVSKPCALNIIILDFRPIQQPAFNRLLIPELSPGPCSSLSNLYPSSTMRPQSFLSTALSLFTALASASISGIAVPSSIAPGSSFRVTIIVVGVFIFTLLGSIPNGAGTMV